MSWLNPHYREFTVWLDEEIMKNIISKYGLDFGVGNQRIN